MLCLIKEMLSIFYLLLESRNLFSFLVCISLLSVELNIGDFDKMLLARLGGSHVSASYDTRLPWFITEGLVTSEPDR